MTSRFSLEELSSSSALSPRPGRREAAQTAQTLNLPGNESEDWRYSPVRDLPVADLAPVAESPDGGAWGDGPAGVLPTSDRAATVTLVDGFVVDIDLDEGWASKGLDIQVDDQRVAPVGDSGPTIFDYWHQAFSPGAVVIRVADGAAIDQPVVIVNHHGASGRVGFPHTVVEVGANAELSVVEWQTSVDDLAASIPVTELDVANAGRLNHLTVQVTGPRFWQLGRQRSSAAGQSTLNTGIAAFGARYARSRIDSRLVGRGGTTNMTAAYYGDGEQVHDFRVFQHHDARDTRSDLVFKGAQDDSSGSIYTGLIHIHPDGAGTNAFQTNRNIKLSEDAWAWSVPNLEIENNEVHCSHASTVSPVDDDQRFYLASRGVPPGPADRLIVAGFFNEVIGRMPVSAVRPELQRFIAAKLDHRRIDS